MIRPITAADGGHPGRCPERDATTRFPETLQLDWHQIRAWRRAGYETSERWTDGASFLIARHSTGSAVYKMSGPVFDECGCHYDGVRVA